MAAHHDVNFLFTAARSKVDTVGSLMVRPLKVETGILGDSNCPSAVYAIGVCALKGTNLSNVV